MFQLSAVDYASCKISGHWRPAGLGGDITQWLHASRSGDKSALDKVFAATYAELRSLAHRQLWGDRGQATLHTTVVVHEAYMKLVGGRPIDYHDRRHFFAVASRAMRQIVVDAVRRRKSLKRGGHVRSASTADDDAFIEALDEDVVALDEALSQLEAVDEQGARIVEWRFFAGLSEEEIGRLLGMTDRSVRRHWREARAFLYRALSTERRR